MSADSIKVIGQTPTLNAPVFAYPSQDTTMEAFDFNPAVWSVDGGKNYSLQAYIYPDLTNAVYTSNMSFENNSSESKIVTFSDKIAAMGNCTDIFYLYAKVTGNNTSSTWSQPLKVSFGVLKMPILNNPIHDTSYIDISSKVYFQWQGNRNSKYKFTLQIDTTTSFNSSSKIEFTNISSTFTTIDNNLLLPNLKYYWRIQGAYQTCTSDWSDVWSFTTKNSTSVNDFSSNNDCLKILPNPINNLGKIYTQNVNNQHSEINIYNIYSEKIKSINIESSNNVSQLIDWDTSALPNGIYYIEYKNGSSYYIEKAMVNK